MDEYPDSGRMLLCSTYVGMYAPQHRKISDERACVTENAIAQRNVV